MLEQRVYGYFAFCRQKLKHINGCSILYASVKINLYVNLWRVTLMIIYAQLYEIYSYSVRYGRFYVSRCVWLTIFAETYIYESCTVYIKKYST